MNKEQLSQKSEQSASWVSQALAAPRIVIAGAGMSGLCLGIRLKQSGFDFQILEKSSDLGGTWFDNTYPNAGCDIPSFLYSYSFAPKYDWSQKYARQPEILEYFRQCAVRFGILDHIEFKTTVEAATFGDDGVWSVETSGGTRECDLFISAVGQLNQPRFPEISGLKKFAGECFHSARWNHECDLRGKRVAVIGNGASAVQFLPEVVRAASHTTVFQRSPNWLHPLRNFRYPPWLHRLFRTMPMMAQAYRAWIFACCEIRFLAFRNTGVINRIYTAWLRYQMRHQIPADRQAELIPDYPAGCKRILLTNDYLQTVTREDVTLERAPIAEITPDSILTDNGSTQADVIILATVFDASRFLDPIRVRGRGQQRLTDAWAEHPVTYLGMLTPNFPNLFMLYGPNTNLGHNSIIYMVESQVEYVVRCIQSMKSRRIRRLEVPEELVRTFDQSLQSNLERTVWNSHCTNWYRTNGTITNNWSSSASAYRAQTKRANPAILVETANHYCPDSASPESAAAPTTAGVASASDRASSVAADTGSRTGNSN